VANIADARRERKRRGDARRPIEGRLSLERETSASAWWASGMAGSRPIG